MGSDILNWIDKIVIGTIEFYGTNNPYDILKAMGINIIKTDPSNSILLGKNCIYIMDNSVIFMRDDLNYKHELFYLGHELGHIVLHYMPGDNYVSKMIQNDGKIEKQANYFALKLGQITFNEIELYEMTIEQVACALELPISPLKQLKNL